MHTIGHTTRFNAPDLSDKQFLRVVSGLRPCRHGGLRLETQSLGSKLLIHNYGHGGCGITLSMGTAIEAGDLLEQQISQKTPVSVLGAGVTGLTTARELAHRGHRVRIYAQRRGVHTLSALAGALFLPVGIDLEHPEIGMQRFREILRNSKSALESLDPKQFGIQQLEVFEPSYAQDDDFVFENGTIEPPTPLDKLPISGPPRCGRSFKTMFIHTKRFLNALVSELDAMGVEFAEHTLHDQSDIEALPDPVIMNCMALGSRTVFQDTAMYPARGILVHMKPQPLGYAVHDSYHYMFPREDALILGGTFDPDVWDDTPDQIIAQRILSHHRRFFAQT
ncbi:MAG: FAD-dependent oxidoreductase [Phycisphaerales bacterium]